MCTYPHLRYFIGGAGGVRRTVPSNAARDIGEFRIRAFGIL